MVETPQIYVLICYLRRTKMSEKIDFVVAWVDGNDVEWQKERFDFLNTGGESNFVASQYRDWEILKYWFRGVETFAPWVNKIYFVTWGHVPEFLNVNHPQIVIVNHKDYIPKQYLPTFSANTIELNLHNIKGLSENFVYFNDDMFIVKPVSKTDFFKDGLPCDSAIIKPVLPARYDSIASLLLNNVAIINENFNKRQVIRKNIGKWFNFRYGILNLLNVDALPWGRFSGFYESHSAVSHNLSTYKEVWDKQFAVMDLTCKNTVRDFKVDVNQWFLKNWRIAKGEFAPRSYKFSKYIMVDSKAKAKYAAKHLKNQSNKIICINDHYKEADLPEVIEIIQEGFDTILGEKSSFEI